MSIKQNMHENHKRRRILFMIGLVASLFCICWFPIHSIHFCLKFLKDFPVCSKLLFTFKALSHTFIYLNSMLNPIFYTIVGNNFRKKAFEQKSRLKSFYCDSNNNNNNNTVNSLRNNKQRSLDSKKLLISSKFKSNNETCIVLLENCKKIVD